MNTVTDPIKPQTPDYTAIKQRQQAAWSSGDYAVVGTTLQIVGENLAEAVDVRAGEHVLDVAAGNGNATLAAARRLAQVISTDYAPSLLDKGRARAEAEGLAVEFQVADVEALPFADGSFDITLSTFGSMFAPDHERTASEMLRVTRPGGRIGLASWTPDSFIGRLFKVIGAHVAPPAGVKPPSLWGSEEHLQVLFGAQATQIHCQRRVFNFRYASPAHFVQVFRDYYGPTHKAFAALDAAGQRALERDLTALIDSMNTAGASSLIVPSHYLEAVITKR
ncbi:MULTISPECIES: class I SAM-dependent methyltransferase [unclassified Roseateles]|uniref:class I SAM-dependent methyltransferase n=1 Tax=unclassified Roseateles TaxID=2626991 RepID=UPI000701E381|nr:MULTISPECIES: class I SAM-dependent methyltransferase [unclassified Roseateles]KQW42429.1 SAM-dependent methyltransferase [Pelomonas sp. Root405]KRA68303.1 SAM-dependent methyltransferase [Pelomonas sp. Root662]